MHLPVTFTFHFFYKVLALNKRNWDLLPIEFPLPVMLIFNFPSAEVCALSAKPVLSQDPGFGSVHLPDHPPPFSFPEETKIMQLLPLSGRFHQIIWNLSVNPTEGPEPPLDQGPKMVENWCLRKE